MRVAEGLADVLILQGEYEEATAYLEQARTMVKAGARRAAIEAKLGDVAFVRGNPSEAKTYLEGALRQLGRRAPRKIRGFLVLLLKELFVYVAQLLPSPAHRAAAA